MENERAAFEQGIAEAEENAVNEAEQQEAKELPSLLDGSKANDHNDSEEHPRMFPGVL